MTYILVEEIAHPRPNPSLAFPEKLAASGAVQTQFESGAPDSASNRHSGQHARLLVYSSTLVLYHEEVGGAASSYSTEVYQTRTARLVPTNTGYSTPKHAPALASVVCAGNVMGCDVLTVLTPTV